MSEQNQFEHFEEKIDEAERKANGSGEPGSNASRGAEPAPNANGSGEPGSSANEGGEAGPDVDAEIASLACLSLLEYEKARVHAADRLKFRVSTLDKLVEKARPKPEEENGQGKTITFDEIDPWPEPVSGEVLLAELTTTLREHVVLTGNQALAVVLWAFHAHALDKADHSPRLHISSPVKRCGKTVLLRIVAGLVPRPVPVSHATTAALFRILESHRPSILIDEVDTFLKENEEMRGVLNSGHERDGQLLRVVGDDHEPRAFRVWGAVALAGIGEIPATIEDRSITIHLRRRRKDEEIQRLRGSRDHVADLARKIARWVADNESGLSDDPSLPEDLNDRAQDNWRPLLAIADAISEDTGKRARVAALAVESETADTDDAGVMLLIDVHGIFEAAPKNDVLSVKYIVDKLTKLEGQQPWAEWKRGKPLTTNSVARLLKPFGIRSKQVKRFNAKGYERAAIAEGQAPLRRDGFSNR